MRIRLWIYLGVSSLMSAGFLYADEGAVLRILPIGDSITQGGVRGRPEYTYRYPLQRMLHEREIAFEFLGTRTQGVHRNAVWPEIAPGVPFDANHLGYYGAKTAKVAENLREALPRLARPDVALIHLGTNDQSSRDYQESIVAPMRDMIGMLREKNPGIVILIGHLNFNEGAALQIRPLVEEMAEDLHTAQSPVRTVHMYRGWIENPNHPQTDTFDWAHPNPQGQEKMARAWLEVLEDLRTQQPAGR